MRKNSALDVTKNQVVFFDDKRNEKGAKNRKKSREKKPSVITKILQKHRDRISVLSQKFGKVQMCVFGKNAARALLAISKISKVEKVDDFSGGVRFFVDGKHLSKIIALLQNLCYNYKIINIYGCAPSALRLLFRAGVVLGVCVVVCAMAIYSTHIGRVSVNFVGGDAQKSDVYAILDKWGLEQGAKINAVDIDCIQREICALDKVAFASVTRQGNRLNVLVKSELNKDYVLDVAGSSVVAKKIAVVTRVVVEGGTAVKKYGDVVKVGDVIIDGYTEWGDERIAVEARGYAYGKVYYSCTQAFCDEQVVSTVVGCKNFTRIGAFGKVPKMPDSPYEKYTLKTSVNDYGFLIPLKLYTYRYEQIVESVEKCELKEDEMKKATYSSLVTQIDENAKICDVKYEISRSNDATLVHLTIETEEMIT